MLNAEQLADWERDGFLVLPELVSADACDELIARAETLVAGYDDAAHRSVFTTDEQQRHADELFLRSSDGIEFFLEADALDDGGTLTVPIERAFNKMGHAQHDLDPVFDRFSRQPILAELVADLGMAEPLLLQSMSIFKHPHIGGEVTSHQDATFLYTEPVSVIGLWFALEDATVDNGCLFAQPGGHRSPLRRRMHRLATGGVGFTELDDTAMPELGDPELVPLETPKGTCVVLHGLLPHGSHPNRSARSRHAYSVHLIDGAATYPDDNWLLRTEPPLRGFSA
ncbi:MAG: phytanoyl-CoA dioxygenase family protein [Acidimicrobiales bacterium]